jgi:hypothetical protein
VIDQILIYVLDKINFLTVDLDSFMSLYCIHWTGAAQILSQALLKVLLDGYQVNLELRILGLILNLYTLLFRLSSSFLVGNRWYSPWDFNGNPICIRGLVRDVD